MSIVSDHVGLFRTLWADRFTETVTVDETTARGAINNTSLLYDSPTEPQVFAGKCLIRPADSGRLIDFGQVGKFYSDYDVFFPWDTTGLKPDQRITVSASDEDPELVGKVFKIMPSTELDSYRTRTKVKAELDLGSGQEV